MSPPSTSEHVYTNDTPVIQLDAKEAFNLLTSKEKLYAHHLSKASWYGSLIVLYQTSPESPLIFSLFRQLFSSGNGFDELKKVAIEVADFNEEEWRVR
jgi:dipeptidyl-peptidase-3